MAHHSQNVTLSTENLSGAMMLRKFSITSQLEMLLPATVAGNCTDMSNFAWGLRYKLCGKYSGTQSDTFFTVCIFIVVDVVFFFFVQFTLI